MDGSKNHDSTTASNSQINLRPENAKKTSDKHEIKSAAHVRVINQDGSLNTKGVKICIIS